MLVSYHTFPRLYHQRTQAPIMLDNLRSQPAIGPKRINSVEAETAVLSLHMNMSPKEVTGPGRWWVLDWLMPFKLARDVLLLVTLHADLQDSQPSCHHSIYGLRFPCNDN